MDSNVRWTVGLGLLVSSLSAAAVVLLLGSARPMAFLAWWVFLESLQVPFIAAARRGRIDPCTAWIRRTVTGRSPAP